MPRRCDVNIACANGPISFACGARDAFSAARSVYSLAFRMICRTIATVWSRASGWATPLFRNRTRRRLREAARLMDHELRQGQDVLLIAREAGAAASYWDLCAAPARSVGPRRPLAGGARYASLVLIALHPRLPAHIFARYAGELPLRAQLLAIHIRGDRTLWLFPRRLVGAKAPDTLSPVP